MLIKILLKIWPALTPILLYAIWQLFIKKIINRLLRKNYCAKNNNSQSNNEEKIIEGEFAEVKKNQENQNFSAKKNDEEPNKIFSLNNKNFVIILYLSLILAIACVISFGF
jgi:hypothetical protein